MLLQYKGVELGPPGEAPRQVVRGAEEEVDAEREVRGVKQRAALALDQRARSAGAPSASRWCR